CGLLLFLAQGWFELNLELVRSRLEPGSYGRLALLRSVLSLAFGAAGAYVAGAAGLVGGLAAGIGLTYVLLDGRRGWRGAPAAVDGQLLRRLLTYGLPLTITFALGFVVNSSDRFLLGWLLGTDAAGLYSAGYDIAQFTVTMLLTVINLAAYPLTVRALEEEGAEAARRQLADTLLLLLLIGLPATAGLALLAGPLSAVIVSAEFRAAAVTVIPWIAVAALLHGLKAFYVDVSFQLGGDTRLQAWVMAAAAGVNIVLNVLFIPLFGILGAVWATVIVFAGGFIGSLLLTARSFRLPRPSGVLLKPLAATALMSGLLLLAPEPDGVLQLLLTVAGAAAAYGLALLLLFPGTVRVLRGRLGL
ncbi:MAG TPA: polysaccharide biosynthesis C-terminal domain-containing protein, partial [Deinococcales bacterium]|nr:polysaccharide biosynthesis C-terminal domain-containing protein [Deinococcales bacterium]